MAVAAGVVVLSGCVNSKPALRSTAPARHSAAPSAAPTVPPEFRSACGHPGAHVEVRHVPVTVRHAECDLDGVLVTYKQYGGIYVGTTPGGTGSSTGLSVGVANGSLDVTIHAQGEPGNA